MTSLLSTRMIRLTELCYTSKHFSQRILQVWRVLSSRDIYQLIRLVIFILLDIFLGLCLAHALKSLFLTPQRSIGKMKYAAFKTILAAKIRFPTLQVEI